MLEFFRHVSATRFRSGPELKAEVGDRTLRKFKPPKVKEVRMISELGVLFARFEL